MTYISIAILSAIIGGFVVWLIMSFPNKRTVEGMNAEETLRAKLRAAHAENSHLRASLIAIRNRFAAQKSGTAMSAVRMAKDGLAT